MIDYEKLGTLAVRWMAVAFFVLTFIFLILAGTMGSMGSMMGDSQRGMSDHMGGATMWGGAWMWLGPTLLSLIIGGVLYAVSGPLGRLMAFGLGSKPPVTGRAVPAGSGPGST